MDQERNFSSLTFALLTLEQASELKTDAKRRYRGVGSGV